MHAKNNLKTTKKKIPIILLLSSWNKELVFFVADAVKKSRHSTLRSGSGYGGYFFQPLSGAKTQGEECRAVRYFFSTVHSHGDYGNFRPISQARSVTRDTNGEVGHYLELSMVRQA